MHNSIILGDCGDNLTWRFDAETSTLTIDGSGEMYGYDCYPFSPWHSYSSQILHVVFPDGLTRIGCNAFSGCSELTQITFPTSLTEIDYGAFSGCTELTQIIFPEGLTRIGMSAFERCTKLTNVVIPASVTEIGTYAFLFCPCERGVLMRNFDAIAGVNKIKECKRELSHGIIWDDSSFRNPCDLLKKCEEKYGRKAIDIIFAASVLLHRYTADIPTRPSEELIEWAEKVPMLDGDLYEQYLRFSLVAPWGANATRVYSVIRRYVYEFQKECG